MARRESYTKVEKYNRITGLGNRKGDKQYKAINCPRPSCDNFVYFPAETIKDGFVIECTRCGYSIEDGKHTHIYDYDLINTKEHELIESGDFLISHRDLVERARLYKYCVICQALKPNEDFDNHGSRRTGRQGECNHCKQVYNSIKNQTRIPEQHREASRNREFFKVLADEDSTKLNKKSLLERYDNECIGCGTKFFDNKNNQLVEIHWDHLLPSKYLWPLVDWNTTPLCKNCNLEKSAKWPDQFYKTDSQLRKIAAISGVSFDKLKSPEPIYYQAAVNKLKNPDEIFNLLNAFGHRYQQEIKRMDKRILSDLGFSFLRIAVDAGKISSAWLK
ncbi:TPA: hypothetical protein NJ315_004095 [Vibrio parahaemolyticus]|nr:hypothetical protein [Vibrio parahaemolyticus]